MITYDQMKRMTSEYFVAVRDQRDVWVPANGGHEQPSPTPLGITVLYVYNPARGEHAYLIVATDAIMSQEEVDEALSLH